MLSVVLTTWNSSTTHHIRRTSQEKWTVTWFWSCAVACLTVVAYLKLPNFVVYTNCPLCVLNNVAKCVLDVKSGRVMSLSLKYSTNLIHSFFLVRMNTGANHMPHLNHFHTFHSCFIQTQCAKGKRSGMKPCKIMTDNQNMYETSMKDVQQQHFFYRKSESDWNVSVNLDCYVFCLFWFI